MVTDFPAGHRISVTRTPKESAYEHIATYHSWSDSRRSGSHRGSGSCTRRSPGAATTSGCAAWRHRPWSAKSRREPAESRSARPPSTDHGTLPNLRFSFSDAHMRQETGGWTRQITVRELGVSKNIAGVNMRLNAGGVRELHWHKAAEWAYMLYGSARITAIDAQGPHLRRRRRRRRPLVFPVRHSALDPGPRSGWLRISPGLRRRRLRRGQHVPDQRLVQAHAERGAGKEFRRSGLVVRTHARSQRAVHFPCRRARPAGIRQDVWAPAAVPAELQPPDAGADSRSRPRAALSASPIPASSRHPPRSPPRWSRSSPAECANCIGIPTPTNGNIGSKARDAWAYLRVQAKHARSISRPATSAMCRSRWATTSRTPATTTFRFLEIFKSSYFADLSLNQWMALTPPELLQAI